MLKLQVFLDAKKKVWKKYQNVNSGYFWAVEFGYVFLFLCNCVFGNKYAVLYFKKENKKNLEAKMDYPLALRKEDSKPVFSK